MAVADRLLSVRQVADRLGVSTRQVWKLASSGRLPEPVRLGRSVRWKESCLAEFLRVGCDMKQYKVETEGETR